MLVSDQTITAPLTAHHVWVWLVSPVICSHKNSCQAREWSQEKSGPLLWVMPVPHRWRRQSDDTRALSWQISDTLHYPVPLQDVCWVSIIGRDNIFRHTAVLWGVRRWDCVKFLQIIMQDLLRVKVQDKFLVYNKIMAIKQVCIEISRFPDWRYGHDMANTWARMFWWFFIRSRIQRTYSYSNLAIFLQREGFEYF